MENQKISLGKNERIDDLGYDDLKIIQNTKFFCFGIDSVLLADFASDIKKNSVVVDLGTGNGILPILLSKKIQSKEIIGVEIQKELVELANKNIKMNELENKIRIIHSDIKELENKIEKNKIDAIVTNPPYKKINTGIQNENKNKLIARHEIEANLSDFIKTSYDLLKDKGTLYMVHRAERLPEIFFYLKKFKMEPKELCLVQNTVDTPPKLVLIKAVKNAQEFLKIRKNIYIRNINGTESAEIQKIRKGRK